MSGEPLRMPQQNTKQQICTNLQNTFLFGEDGSSRVLRKSFASKALDKSRSWGQGPSEHARCIKVHEMRKVRRVREYVLTGEGLSAPAGGGGAGVPSRA